MCWAEMTVAGLSSYLLGQRKPLSRPVIIAVDGRGGAGKSYLSERLSAATPNSVVVHTDDLAWHHSFFDWADLAIEGVLKPLSQGREISYRPPGWIKMQRAGEISLAAGADVVWFEGTGALRAELRPWLDAGIWVTSEKTQASRRLIERDGDGREQERLRRDWGKEESPFLRLHQPWTHASAIVNGTIIGSADTLKVHTGPAVSDPDMH